MSAPARRPAAAVEELVAAYRTALLEAGMFAGHPVTRSPPSPGGG